MIFKCHQQPSNKTMFFRASSSKQKLSSWSKRQRSKTKNFFINKTENLVPIWPSRNLFIIISQDLISSNSTQNLLSSFQRLLHHQERLLAHHHLPKNHLATSNHFQTCSTTGITKLNVLFVKSSFVVAMAMNVSNSSVVSILSLGVFQFQPQSRIVARTTGFSRTESSIQKCPSGN